MRWRVGGVGVGVAVGWNIATLGPIATRLAHVYGVSLTTIGLFVTVQFVMHMVMQVPGERGDFADRAYAKQEQQDPGQNRNVRAGNHQRVKCAGAAEILSPDLLQLGSLADQHGLHHARGAEPPSVDHVLLSRGG